MSLSFDAVEDGEAVEVFDSVERHRYAFETDRAVDPSAVSARRMDAPVDAAVEIETAAIELPDITLVYVRDSERETIAEAEQLADIDLPEDRYTLELTTPIKTYLEVEAPLQVTADAENTTISFGEPEEIVVGARSRHEQPEYTVTTTEKPEDMMAAVSSLSAALKETTPERSYPTMRGHPAMVELGDELDIPEEMPVPETGVEIEVPPDLGSVYVVAPLAFYLGAEMVPGDKPRIIADDFEYTLEHPDGLSRAVERTLKQVFFLDCCVRTEGLYRVDLHEREQIEQLLPESPETLYHASLAEQLEAYLSIRFEQLSSHMPDWKLTTHVAPDPDSVELLPFLLDDLAVIRLPETQEVGGTESEEAAIEEFVRDGEFTRSAGDVSSPTMGTVRPGEAESLEQAWVGTGAPLGASKPTGEAFKNRLNREQADGDIDITVVCNDPQMAEERDVVEEVYGDRDGLPFDISVHRDLTCAELEIVLTTQADLLHYIGHIDDEGFDCEDGKLDARSVDEIGVDAFFLNACQSYDQGMALIEAGGIGGVVTLREVVNSGAVAVGSTLAQLLNRGFPLRTGLDIARGESVMGNQYLVVGDGGLSLTQTESGSALLTEVEENGDDWEFTIHSYPTESKGMGSMFLPFIEEVDSYYLGGGEIDTFRVTQSDLVGLLSMENYPVRYEGSLTWSSDLLGKLL